MEKTDPFVTGLRRFFADHPDVKPATISAVAGLNKSAIRKMLEGHVASPRHQTMHAIARALGTTVEALIGQTATLAAPGAAEDATPYTPRPVHPGAAMDAYLAPQTAHRLTMRAGRGAPMLGVLPGDVLVIDMRSAPRAGDTVVANVLTGNTAKMRILRFLPPHLTSADPLEPPIPESSARIQGSIVALARGPGL